MTMSDANGPLMPLSNQALRVIYDFLQRCSKVGIKNPVEFILSKKLQLYDWTDGCFPRGIKPTDVDGEVEVNGYFLRFEFKHEAAVLSGKLPKGQLICLEQLVHLNRFTVFVVGHSDDSGEPTCIQVFSKVSKTGVAACNLKKLRYWCKTWADKAERRAL